MSKDFLVVARSDCCTTSFPDNSPDTFSMQLSKPVSLTGKWFVGLQEISFGYEWIKFERPRTGVHIISTMLNLEGDLTILSKLLFAKRNPSSDYVRMIYDVDENDRENRFISNFVEIPSESYGSPQQLGNALSDVINELLPRVHNLPPDQAVFLYDYDSYTKTGHYVIAHETLSVFLVFERPFIPIFLGLTSDAVYPRYADNVLLIDRRLVYFTYGNSKPFLLRSMKHLSPSSAIDSIYVYCSLVEPQYVGDSVAPLLDIVPLRTSTDSHHIYKFKTIMYQPLATKSFSTISFKLRSDRGINIPFPSHCCVECVLQFTRNSYKRA